MHKKTVTLVPGDGVGPEVTGAACRIIEAAGVPVQWEVCEAGAEVFKKGLATGVPQETIDSIQRNRVALKGPLQTPVGYGENSANVTLRKFFETFGNIRPVREIPGVVTPYSGRGIDCVIVRENVEDLYAGIEYRDTPGVAKCLKLISRKGCEKIVRLAFEVARAEGRTEVHCASKSNIMKMTEGLLKRTFEAIAPEYPEIRAQHVIVDNCAHQMVKKPEQFQVIVTTNMNGDILSDLGSALIGGLGFAPGANIGHDVAIFEAVHGSAPKYAGQNTINPSAVIFSATMMLRHLGFFEAADSIEHALVLTLEEGKTVPRDVPGVRSPASTTAFTDAVIARLGQKSSRWVPRVSRALKIPALDPRADVVQVRERRVRGLDVYLESARTPADLGAALEAVVAGSVFRLAQISCRGVKVWPVGGFSPDVVDHWRCRFLMRDEQASAGPEHEAELLALLKRDFVWSTLQKLWIFDGEAAWSKAQGET